MTEQSIMQAAHLWRELTRRGEDLSDIRFPLAPFMLPLAQGTLLPELAIAMAGQVRSLQRVAELPVADQRRLLAGEEIPIVKPDTGVVTKPLKKLSFPEIVTVIRGGRIIGPEEQRRAIATRPVRQTRKSTMVEIRLSPDTYNDAAIAAADAGMRMDEYLRRLIIAGMRRGAS